MPCVYEAESHEQEVTDGNPHELLINDSKSHISVASLSSCSTPSVFVAFVIFPYRANRIEATTP
jgi:hypothetical protein